MLINLDGISLSTNQTNATCFAVWPASDPAREILAHEFGNPTSEIVRVCDGYSVAYDPRTRNPK